MALIKNKEKIKFPNTSTTNVAINFSRFFAMHKIFNTDAL